MYTPTAFLTHFADYSVLLNVRTRLEVQADPACVDLRSRSPYFYELGCKVAPM